MGKTSIYKLGYFEPGMNIGEELDLDELRFTAIDTQTLALFSIFGNGVLDDDPDNPSWYINTIPQDYLNVSITPGKGHVAWKSAATTETRTLTLPVLPTAATTALFWIYAIENDNTPSTKDVDFIVSLIEINDPDNYIGLGAVYLDKTTNPYTITAYNTSEYGRKNISLFSTLSDIVNKHKHIGGSNNPSPINLRSHVRGKLSGDYLENLDLSTVTSGVLSADRLPTIDHNSLSNIGTLTHTQIDSLLASLTSLPDNYRLSDVSLANRLKIILALKRQAGLGTIDNTQINAIFYVPGVTSSSFVATGVPAYINLANVDTVNKRIEGTTSSSINADTLIWNTYDDFDRAWQAAQIRTIANQPPSENIAVIGSGVNGSFTVSKSVDYKPVVNTSLTDTKWKDGYLFIDKATKETIVPPPPPTLSAPAFYNQYSDNFDVERYLYYEFTASQDWSARSNIGFGFGIAAGSIPGNIYAYLVLESGGTSKTIMVGGNETTINRSATALLLSSSYSDSKIRLFFSKNLSEFNITESQKKRIKGVGFIWSTEENWDGNELNFYLLSPNNDEISPVSNPKPDLIAAKTAYPDTTSSIFIWNETLYNRTATLVFRFDSNSSNTSYNLVQWDSTIPAGTQVKVYVRSAANEASLGNYLTNEVSSLNYLVPSPASTGRYFDIIVVLSSNSSYSSAPTLDRLILSYDGVGSSTSKIWNKTETNLSTGQTGWYSTASNYSNITYGPNVIDGGLTKNYLTITNTSDVGKWKYLRANNLYQALNASDEVLLEDGVDSGNLKAYQSPVQVYNNNSEYGFNNPKRYVKLFDESYLYADTKNDRVIEISSSGSVNRIFQGNLRLKQYNRDFVALNAYYNPTEGKFFINFSQYVTISNTTVIYIISGQQSIKASDTGLSTILFSPIAGQSSTIQITLNSSYKTIVNSWTAPIQIILDNGSVTSNGNDGLTIDAGTTSSTGTQALDFLDITTYTALIGEGKNITGISTYTPVVLDDADFDNDGAITTTLLGPNNQSGRVTLGVVSGPIYMLNILEPVAVSKTKYDLYLISNVHTDSIIAVDTTGATIWSVPSTIASFTLDKLGGAIELSNENLLVALPSSANDNAGKVLLINRISSNTVLNDLSVIGDAVEVRESPYADQYYVLLSDTVNNGAQSRVIRLSSSGNITWSWGTGTLIAPTGLNVLANNNILVSE